MKTLVMGFEGQGAMLRRDVLEDVCHEHTSGDIAERGPQACRP